MSIKTKSKKTVLSILSYLFLMVSVGVFFFIIQSFTDDEVKPALANYSMQGVEIPTQLEFAGERVPLEYFDIRESLDRELIVNTYFHSQTIMIIKQSKRYFSIIEPILKKNGIPDDFKYMAVTESNLSNSVSPAGAVGFWQILKDTGIENGLEINDHVDERYHLEKSTEAACKYLKESYNKYGNWTMAAASYNGGRRGIDRQIGRQKEKNYYDLLFAEETSRYIFRILAFKVVMEDPEKYGFFIEEKNKYEEIPSIIVEVDTSISNLADFAKLYSINYKILKKFNPWLRDTSLLNPKNRKYEIVIPEKRESNN